MDKQYTQLTKSEVLAHFGSQSKIARKLDISRQAVCLWPEQLSELTCLRLQVYYPKDFKAIVKKRLLPAPEKGL